MHHGCPGEGSVLMQVTREKASVRCGYHGWGACIAVTQGGEHACHQACVVLLLWGRLRSFLIR